MSILGETHQNLVYPARISHLAGHIAAALPPNARVLDVGCGDGLLAFHISKLRPDVAIAGIDVLIRSKTFIPVTQFDGTAIPHGEGSFDAVTFVDVLHHCVDPTILLREASRVTRNSIIIKDHTRNGPFAATRLRFMDWVGNARHGVVLPYNYWSKQRWRAELQNLGLVVESWQADLHLYPWWGNWMFGSSLHFIASLSRGRGEHSPAESSTIWESRIL
jgi:SAM-dependent methyltransferase